MLKITFTVLLVIFFINASNAQKNFTVTIKLDSSVNINKLHFRYKNGNTLITIPDTFGNRRIVLLKGEYYGQLVALDIFYNWAYLNSFFINDSPATINCKLNKKGEPRYDHSKNVSIIGDTLSNNTYRDLFYFTAKERHAEINFIKNNDLSNDSIQNVHQQVYKALAKRDMLFFKMHHSDYFSFWLFRDWVTDLSLIYLKDDIPYLKSQLAFFKSTFPKRYVESFEGKRIMKDYELLINPSKLNDIAPDFTVKAIDGSQLHLKDYKGKYILLDFWATWCGPCMANIPSMKNIRANYPANKLIIVGISQDNDLKKLKVVIKQKGLDWLQVFDVQKEISQMYGVNAFPTLLLINPQGRIVYKSDYVKDDIAELPKLLTDMK